MKQLHFNTPQFFRAFIFINIIVERLSSITKLAKHFMENPILPFDKSRSVAHLTDSSHLIFRTSLFVLLLLLLFSIYLFIYLFGFKSYISNLKKPSCFASHWLEKKKKSSNTKHGFHNRTGPGGRIMKTRNRDENQFFKPKEPDFLLILWTPKTGVGLHELG